MAELRLSEVAELYAIVRAILRLAKRAAELAKVESDPSIEGEAEALVVAIVTAFSNKYGFLDHESLAIDWEKGDVILHGQEGE